MKLTRRGRILRNSIIVAILYLIFSYLFPMYNKLNIFKKGLKAAEKSCKIGVTQNQGWIVMEDQ